MRVYNYCPHVKGSSLWVNCWGCKKPWPGETLDDDLHCPECNIENETNSGDAE